MTADAILASATKVQAVVSSGIANELLDQADAVLDRLVSAYNSKALDDRDAAVGIATIAELRRAAGKANRAVLVGTELVASTTGASKR